MISPCHCEPAFGGRGNLNACMKNSAGLGKGKGCTMDGGGDSSASFLKEGWLRNDIVYITYTSL